MSRVRQLFRNPWLRRILQWIIIVVPLAYVVRSVADNWQALSAYGRQFDARWAIVALICFLLVRCVMGLVSQLALSSLGFSLNPGIVFRAYHLSALSAYLPGGLYIGRPVILGQYGVDAISTSAGVMIELTTAGLLDALGSVPYLLYAGAGVWSRFWGLGLLAVLSMLIMVNPAVVNRVLRWLLKRVGYENRVVNLTVRQLVRMLLLEAICWSLAGLMSYALVASIYPVPIRLLPVLASASSLTTFLANVLSLTPASLGIYEGVGTLVMAPLLPAPVPALLSIMARVLTTVARLLLFGLAAWLSRYSPPTKAPAQGASAK